MSRNERIFLIALALGAVMIRLAHVAFEAGTAWFDDPVGGERALAELAARLAAGRGWGDMATEMTRPPLYPYLLAAMMSVSGSTLWLPRLLQAGLDAGSCVLAYAIARELFDRRAAVVAGVATALNGALVYFSARLSDATLAVFLGLAVVWLLLRARRSGRVGWWIAAGGACGVAALCRSEMLLMIPVAVAFAAVSCETWGRRGIAAGTVVAAALVCVAPATIRNYRVAGHFVPVSTEAGVRVYVGASDEFDGMLAPRPGRDQEMLARVPGMLGIEGSAAQSRYYLVRAVHLAGAEPGRYAARVAKKLYLFWHGNELPDDFDPYAHRRDSPVLATLLYHSVLLYVPFGLLAPFALLGIVVAWRRSGAGLLAAFVGVHLCAAALFLPTAATRLPAAAALGIFAAAGVVWLYDAARDPTRRTRLWVATGALVALFVALNASAPFGEQRRHNVERLSAERLHWRGVDLYEHGDAVGAAQLLERSVMLHPTALAWRDLGKALIVSGHNAEGIDALMKSVALATGDLGAERWINPNQQLMNRLREVDPARTPDLEPYRQLLEAHECYRRHRWECAAPVFERIAKEAPAGSLMRDGAEHYYAQSVAGEGIDMAAQFRYKGAIDTLRRAQALGAGNVETHLLLGLSYLRRGQRLLARHEFLAFRFTEKPMGAFFYSAARPDNDIEGALGFTIVTGYLSVIPDDPLARDAEAVISEHWRTKAGLQPSK